MDDNNFSLQQEDKEKIKISVQLHSPIEITTYTLPKNMEIYIQEVLSEFLIQCHQEHMTEYLKFCVGELLSNSKKANTKRIYFQEKGLDINKEIDYNEGMVFFKEDTLNNINHYLEEQKKAGLYVKLLLHVDENFVNIEIRNNVLLTKHEEQRIRDKIDTAQQFDSMEDVFTRVLDQTEGAGLGIIIIILMLQKIGLSKQNYKVFCTDTETVTRIELPLNDKYIEYMDIISDDFVKTQNAIPVLKNNLSAINKILNSQNPTTADLVDLFSKDATLSFILLKDVVAAKKHCCSLIDAIEEQGIEKLKCLFAENNPQIRVIENGDSFEKNLQHCYKVAFFAYNLAKNFSPKKAVTPDLIFIYALLHDIECVFVSAMDDEQKKIINENCQNNDIPEEVLNLFYDGSYHCNAGCLLSSKWGYPDCITQVIKYHNVPERAPEDIKEIVNYVYLADIIQYYDEKKIAFYQLNKKVLDSFGINTEAKFNYIISQIKSVY